jgi:hypothetical protein
VRDAQQAAQLPLGMVQDPRLADWQTQLWKIGQKGQSTARLFTARALQLQARGDSRAALNHLDTVLGLSRQMKNYAPLQLFESGNDMERIALIGLHHWLRKVGPDKELLRAALDILQRHEAATPPAVNAIKAQYLVDRNSSTQFPPRKLLGDKLLHIAALVPWEKQRQSRILHAIYAAQLREIQKPLWQNPAWKQRGQKVDPVSAVALELGLPPEEGTGSHLSARQWGDYLREGMHNYVIVYRVPQQLTARSQRALHAAQLVVCAALYQANNGQPPAKLDALLAPGYLAALPIDPFTGRPFRYRISEGEVFGDEMENALTLVPGQAVVECEDGSQRYPVPVWP